MQESREATESVRVKSIMLTGILGKGQAEEGTLLVVAMSRGIDRADAAQALYELVKSGVVKKGKNGHTPLLRVTDQISALDSMRREDKEILGASMAKRIYSMEQTELEMFTRFFGRSPRFRDGALPYFGVSGKMMPDAVYRAIIDFAMSSSAKTKVWMGREIGRYAHVLDPEVLTLAVESAKSNLLSQFTRGIVWGLLENYNSGNQRNGIKSALTDILELYHKTTPKSEWRSKHRIFMDVPRNIINIAREIVSESPESRLGSLLRDVNFYTHGKEIKKIAELRRAETNTGQAAR